MQMGSHGTQGGKIRVGAVTYLNARPLVFSLAKIAPQVEMVVDLPSRLADALAAGQLDVAMIPSIEYARQPGYAIISDACIACDGAVRSVKLYSRVPIERIRTPGVGRGLADQRRTGADSAEGAVRNLARDPTVADRRLRVRHVGRRRDVDRRPGHVADRRAIRVRVGLGRRVVAVDGLAVCVRHVDCPAGRRSVGDWRGLGGRPRRRHHPAGGDCPQAAPAIGVPEADCLSYLRDHLEFHLGLGSGKDWNIFSHWPGATTRPGGSEACVLWRGGISMTGCMPHTSAGVGMPIKPCPRYGLKHAGDDKRHPRQSDLRPTAERPTKGSCCWSRTIWPRWAGRPTPSPGGCIPSRFAPTTSTATSTTRTSARAAAASARSRASWATRTPTSSAATNCTGRSKRRSPWAATRFCCRAACIRI